MHYKRLGIYVLTGVAFSTAIVLAKDIPGVTRPYDPPNYYSPTSVSYPDSRYTPFTMHDLARNGYAVRDVILNKKSIVSDIKSLSDMINNITSVLNLSDEQTPLSKDVSTKHLAAFGGILARTHDYTGFLRNDLNAWDLFRGTEDKDTINEDIVAQKKALEQTYKDAMQIAKTESQDLATTTALLAAMDQAGNAKGDLAASQANTQVRSVLLVEKARANRLLANYTAVEAAHQKAKMDQELKAWKDSRNGMAFITIDPYHPSKDDARKYTRPQGQGFIDFN